MSYIPLAHTFLTIAHVRMRAVKPSNHVQDEFIVSTSQERSWESELKGNLKADTPNDAKMIWS